MKTLLGFVLLLLTCSALSAQSALPSHYYCVTSGVNNGLMHPSVSLRHLFIYNQAEIAAMTLPVTGPVVISRIFFRTNNTGTATYTNLNIRMGHSSTANASTATTFATNFNVGAPVTVFSAASHSLVMSGNNTGCGTAGTWFYIDLTTPFSYDFSNNLVVELSYSSQSGTIPSFYALNPGGGANPSAISAATTAAATGSLTARPMFGISATPLDGTTLRLGLTRDAEQPRLYWDVAQLNHLTAASLHIQGPAGAPQVVVLPDDGHLAPDLLGAGHFQAWIAGIEMDGAVTHSNVVSWHQAVAFRSFPQPWHDVLTIELAAAGAVAALYDAQGRLCWQQMDCPAQVVLREPFPVGVYFLKVVASDGTQQLRRLVKI